MKNAKVDASLYLLTGLLQRLEKNHSGMLSEMIRAVKADQASISKDIPEKEHIDDIFKEALLLLEQTNAMLKDNEHT